MTMLETLESLGGDPEEEMAADALWARDIIARDRAFDLLRRLVEQRGRRQTLEATRAIRRMLGMEP